MASLFEAYRQELQEHDLAADTLKHYEIVLRRFEGWLADRELSKGTAQGYLADLRRRGYQPGTVAFHYHILRGFFEFAGLTLKLRLRTPRKLPRHYDSGDLERLLAEVRRGQPRQPDRTKRRNYALVCLMVSTGIRRGEAIGLRVKDVDLGERVIRVHGKGDQERAVPLPDRAVVPLWDECMGKAAGERVFPLHGSEVYRVVTRAARKAGLAGFKVHDLRHYYASTLVQRGADLQAVRELMGHSNISTTSVYLRANPIHLRNTVALLEQGEPAATYPR